MMSGFQQYIVKFSIANLFRCPSRRRVIFTGTLEYVLEAVCVVALFQVDCTVYERLCDNYGVENYPVTVWFKDGQKVRNTNT